jgi:hypothetical protein
MWQCDNCGYTDEDVTAFEEDTEEGLEEPVRYCPECGSDEIFQVDDDDDDGDDDTYVEVEEEDAEEDDDDDLDDDDDDDDWDADGNGDGDDDW